MTDTLPTAQVKRGVTLRRISSTGYAIGCVADQPAAEPVPDSVNVRQRPRPRPRRRRRRSRSASQRPAASAEDGRPRTRETSRGFAKSLKPVADRGPVPPERLRYLARTLYGLGERPLHEFLREVLDGRDVRDHLEAYARLAPYADFIASIGGDRLQPPHAIEGGRE